MTPPPLIKTLSATPITSAAFQPFGQLIGTTEDGKPYDDQDAQLVLDRGIPRFYIMRLHHKALQFSRITRHRQCTQCLGALNGCDWLMAVAPASDNAEPDIAAIAAFHIPGDCFIKLHVGTWHAGPYFTHEFVDFYNLELSDTNSVDHETVDLRSRYQVEFALQPCP